MAEAKLIRYLQTFSEAEAAAFPAFLAADYFGASAPLRRLLTYLLQLYPDWEELLRTKERLFAQSFPGEPYEDKRLRYLFTDACRFVELFWNVNAYEANSGQQELDLLREFSERGLNKLYESQLRRMKKAQEQRPYTQAKDYYTDYQMQALAEEHFERQRLRRFDRNIEQAADTLDRFYFFQQLTYACGMLERQNILEGTYNLPFTAAWLEHLRGRAFFGDPQIELFHAILQMQRHDDEEYFRQLIQQLRRVQLIASPEVLRSAYLAAINYCARHIRKGKQSYVEAALDLYREGLENQVLLNKGQLSPWTFNNVIKLALRLKRYDWIPEFMRSFEELLPDKFRADAVAFNQAELYYYTQRLPEAQEALLQVSYTDLNYYLGARVLLAKIYFEQDDMEPLLSLLAAFMMFLKRNRKLSQNLRKTYLNFCELLFQITKRRPKKAESLRQRIRQTQPLTDRQWLLDNLEASL